jgi:hypothetical protein
VDTAYIHNFSSKPIKSLPSHNTVANPVLPGVSKAPIPRQQRLKEIATCAPNSEVTYRTLYCHSIYVTFPILKTYIHNYFSDEMAFLTYIRRSK